MNHVRAWLSNRKINTVGDATKYLLKRTAQVFAVSFFFVILLFLLSTLANAFASVSWFGFGPYINAQGETEPAKTLWDWLELLVVPLILAIGGVVLNSTIQRAERDRTEQQREAEQKRLEQRQALERERADKQQKTDLEIADDRLKEQALQTYLDRMTELLLEKGLGKPDVSDEVKTVARVRTLTTLRSLDGVRKSTLVQFLIEAELVGGEKQVVSLDGADLTAINMLAAELANAILRRSQLKGSSLPLANLEGADLKLSTLNGADLRMAYLGGADLRLAHLDGADLSGATLLKAKVSREQLLTAILNEETILPDGSQYDPKKGLPPAWDIDDPSKPAK